MRLSCKMIKLVAAVATATSLVACSDSSELDEAGELKGRGVVYRCVQTLTGQEFDFGTANQGGEWEWKPVAKNSAKDFSSKLMDLTDLAGQEGLEDFSFVGYRDFLVVGGEGKAQFRIIGILADDSAIMIDHVELDGASYRLVKGSTRVYGSKNVCEELRELLQDYSDSWVDVST